MYWRYYILLYSPGPQIENSNREWLLQKVWNMELLKAGMLYVYFMGQVFREKQLKPPCSLTFQFLVECFKHKKVIAF